jgi:hypothetical protein
MWAIRIETEIQLLEIDKYIQYYPSQSAAVLLSSQRNHWHRPFEVMHMHSHFKPEFEARAAP